MEDPPAAMWERRMVQEETWRTTLRSRGGLVGSPKQRSTIRGVPGGQEWYGPYTLAMICPWLRAALGGCGLGLNAVADPDSVRAEGFQQTIHLPLTTVLSQAGLSRALCLPLSHNWFSGKNRTNTRTIPRM